MADRPGVFARHAPLVAILILAAILRVWGIGFGLPHTLARPDEDATVSIAMRFFRHTFNPGFFDWPSLFMYAVGVCFIAYFQAGRALGWFSYGSFLADASANPSPLFLIARGASAACGVGTVAAVHAAGRRLFDRTTGLVAAFFLAVAALHARDSHFGVTDVAATLLVTVSFLFTVKHAADGRRRDALAAAVWAGLAGSTKYNAALIALPLAWTVLQRRDAARPGDREPASSRLGLLAACGAVTVAAFVAGTPYAILDWPAFRHALEGVAAHLRGGHAGFGGPGWIVHLTSSLRYGLGLPLLAAGVAGLVLGVWRDRRSGVLLAIFPVAYYALIGSGQTAFARYILPVVPFLCLAAAHASVVAAGAIARGLRRPAWSSACAWIGAVAVAVPSLMSAVETDRLLARGDNRLVVADWIRSHYPDGASLAQTGTVAGRVQMAASDPALAVKYPAVDADRQPDLIVVLACPLPYCEPPDGTLQTLLRDRYERLETFEAYDASSRALVYDRDDDFYLPLAGLRDVTRPGPTMTLYKRRQP